jgi:hypothetical protein
MYLESVRRVMHELRQLQLRALGHREQPTLFETAEKVHARQQREEKRSTLLQVVTNCARRVMADLTGLFQPHVDVPAVLTAITSLVERAQGCGIVPVVAASRPSWYGLR